MARSGVSIATSIHPVCSYIYGPEICAMENSGQNIQVRRQVGSNRRRYKHLSKQSKPQLGKAEGQIESQVASSMDTVSDEAFTEHPTDNQEHRIEESNVYSVEQVTKEEKPAAEDEVKFTDFHATYQSKNMLLVY